MPHQPELRLYDRTSTILIPLLIALLLCSTDGWARNSQIAEASVIELTAEQIRTLTSGQTWTIQDKVSGRINHTYYRPDGVRYTRTDGDIVQLGWSTKPQGLRCVHEDTRTRCGIIANIDGQLTICMQYQPRGDCNYVVTERQQGDVYQLANLYGLQPVDPQSFPQR